MTERYESDEPMRDTPMADGGTLDDFGDPTPRPDTDPEEDCAAEDYAAEEASRPADIIFAVDASGSMRGEARAVQDQLNRFATEVLATEVDPHVIMITSPSYVTVPPPLGTDAEHFLMVPEHVGSHSALARILELFPRYSSFLRPNAVTHIVIVTDDESNMRGADFSTQMQMKLGKEFVLHAIASPRPRCSGAAAPGDIYYQLAAETGGVTHPICTGEWTSVFDALAVAVRERASLPCSLSIPETPEGSTWDPMRVNVDYREGGVGEPETLPFVAGEASCDRRGGWYYDHPTEMTAILLCPITCARLTEDTMGTLQVRVGCATELI